MGLDFETVVDGFVRHSLSPVLFFITHNFHLDVFSQKSPTHSAVLRAACLQVEDDDHRVRHLALLSQYAVFKDILPSYRIRVPTAAEMATKVSKDVHRVRAQEAALLRAYQVRVAIVLGSFNLNFNVRRLLRALRSGERFLLPVLNCLVLRCLSLYVCVSLPCHFSW